MLAVLATPLSAVELETWTVTSFGSVVTALMSSVTLVSGESGTAGAVLEGVAASAMASEVLSAWATCPVVAFLSFSPGSGSSLMIASNSARMSSLRGSSLPSASVTPVVGTVTNVMRPAATPCSDCPRSTRSLVLTLST